MQRCAGCRPVLDDAAAEAFQQLCRVVDSRFQEIDASIMFTLRGSVTTEVGLHAFNAIFDGDKAMEVADAFSRAFQRYKNFGDMFEADRTLAIQLAQYAANVHAAKGGFYEGRLDCLRSTMWKMEAVESAV